MNSKTGLKRFFYANDGDVVFKKGEYQHEVNAVRKRVKGEREVKNCPEISPRRKHGPRSKMLREKS